MLRSLLIVVALATTSTLALKHPLEVRYEWNYLNFTWPSRGAYESAVQNGEYIEENNPIAGIKVWKDRMFLTIPRWRHGVPATLLVTPLERVDCNKSPLVAPYPSWSMQRIGVCTALQFVQSMEIDPQGRMWVLDAGRVGTISDDPKNYCPARLVILDLENDGEVLMSYEFPDHVARRETNYLNDIVLEHEDGGYAYISDTDDEYPGVVVFSLRERKSWKVTHESMKATAAKFTVKHDGTKVDMPLNVDSIAISPASTENRRTLYYSPLSSKEVFSIPTSVLKTRPTDVDAHVKLLGEKPSQTDGMIVSADGKLYFGLLADNVVSKWDTEVAPFNKNQQQTYAEDEEMQWPDTFAIAENGDLWVVSNRLQVFLADEVDVAEKNFRVLKLDRLKYKSYQYYEDGSKPELPVV